MGRGEEARQEASLTEAEQNAVMLAVSTRNECHYCTAAHAGIGRQAGLTGRQVEAILDQDELEDERLAALVDATDRILSKEGWLDEDDLAELERRGVDRAQLYEIVALIGLKTVSNYVNHIAGPWRRPTAPRRSVSPSRAPRLGAQNSRRISTRSPSSTTSTSSPSGT